MNPPWAAAQPLPPEELARVRRRAIFDCCKWDPQVEDASTIGAFPLVLAAAEWGELTRFAGALARETLAAEAELMQRPELHRALALPRAVVRGLARESSVPTPGIARLIRFDFHHTSDGWRISEANTDVPGGMNEASGFAALMTGHYPGTSSVGDTVGAYVDALLEQLPDARHIALAHATAYTDDRQVMTYIARRLGERGVRASLISPAHLRWRDGVAGIEAEWTRGPVDAIIRFFPGEWLPNLPSAIEWRRFFSGGRTPVSNPGGALFTQSKRLPLVWDALDTPMPTWRALLPETRDVREIAWRQTSDWVLKPALGRVGEGIGIHGVTAAKEWRQIARSVRWFPRHWVAQRRFSPTPLVIDAETFHPCIGVYTVDGRVAGAYGRLARQPLIDWRAIDVAVLVERERWETAATSDGAESRSAHDDHPLERSA